MYAIFTRDKGHLVSRGYENTLVIELAQASNVATSEGGKEGSGLRIKEVK